MNEASDSRCVRCGRRLHGTARPATFPAGPTTSAATALALDHNAAPAPVAEISPVSAPLAQAPPESGQTSLFRDLPGGAKIVPIPTLSPMRPSSPLDRESVRRNAERSASRPRRQLGDLQQPLDLRERQGQIRSRPDEALYCDARVALPAQRALAAGLDGVVVLIGTGMFLATSFFAGVNLGTLSNILLLPAAMTAVVAILYRGLWCLVNRDTPGMRFAGLRLVDFDGRAPRRDHRIVRQFAGVLSLFSAGVGLVWALVDEERLTWHDHISKTFPTTA